jgi:hypothetical protein
MSATATRERISFSAFYRDVFVAEHRNAANVALHMVGVVASAALLVYAISSGLYWPALAYPIVHAVPGLLGHRLFERNEAVGDVRLTRTDHPLWWFIIGNHMMTFQVLFGDRRWIVTLAFVTAVALAIGAIQDANGQTTALASAYRSAAGALTEVR